MIACFAINLSKFDNEYVDEWTGYITVVKIMACQRI